ncbi:hypothetical protein [Herpetosiphon gulosus]|uniref:DUF1877 family protein n=1 Tax=Herpetosiphon gulosus TaxID=1973496 RepID=A0ABP9WVN9_9CHLR
MGIRQSFVRITAEELTELEQLEGNGAPSPEMLANEPADEDLYHAYWLKVDPLYRVRFQHDRWPSDDQDQQELYAFTLEKGYWELLGRLMKQLVREQVINQWPFTEDYPVHIGDLWPGYSHVYLIFHHELAPLLDMLQQFPYAQLKQRFDNEFVEYITMTDQEKLNVYEAIRDDLDSIRIMAQQAHAANESIIWYIS